MILINNKNASSGKYIGDATLLRLNLPALTEAMLSTTIFDDFEEMAVNENALPMDDFFMLGSQSIPQISSGQPVHLAATQILSSLNLTLVRGSMSYVGNALQNQLSNTIWASQLTTTSPFGGGTNVQTTLDTPLDFDLTMITSTGTEVLTFKNTVDLYIKFSLTFKMDNPIFQMHANGIASLPTIIGSLDPIVKITSQG